MKMLASYTFTGRSIGVLVARDPAYGQVKVYLDGTYLTTVDTKATTHGYRYVIYARAFTSGTHTLKVVLTYSKQVTRHHHRATVKVTKTLKVKFRVC